MEGEEAIHTETPRPRHDWRPLWLLLPLLFLILVGVLALSLSAPHPANLHMYVTPPLDADSNRISFLCPADWRVLRMQPPNAGNAFTMRLTLGPSHSSRWIPSWMLRWKEESSASLILTAARTVNIVNIPYRDEAGPGSVAPNGRRIWRACREQYAYRWTATLEYSRTDKAVYDATQQEIRRSLRVVYGGEGDPP